MGKVLRDIWILTDSGVTFFSRVVNPRMNPQLFGALMSAINIYAEKLINDGISNFTLSEIRFVIIKKNNYIFVANASNKVKMKKVLNELNSISDKFFVLYSKEFLENWNSDISVFTDFKNQIDDSLEEMADKFKKSFW